MGFEIDENVLLKVSGVGAIAYCAFAAAAPREFHNTFMTSTAPLSAAAWRYHGTVGMMETKKDMLKVAGVGWLACAAQNAYNGYSKASLQANPTQPKEIATANAIGQAVLGSLCLMKGFDCC
ncbi:expressed protein [Chlorella variabilis]|uniref:Expressed protein n=1 Tax=Chlorella variabilis TaxID=554065 RepID=E1ZDT0_CHLVA|nr:expressed protein [Chlorella variabilis]EFN55912.1 expressed protein [Chlorella variabilis]|eukprot:XP_005848014.1 expressed protein [Chlorella variabilis]